MTTTFDTSAISNRSDIAVAATTTDGGTSRPPAGMPAGIPADQMYYWTRAWQEGEGRSMADIAPGRTRVFDDPRELARYLLQPAE